MKKQISTLLMVLCASCCVNLNAADQMIAGFEDGETGYQINDGWVSGYEWSIGDNTDNSGINNTPKCVISTAQTPPDSWGGWFIIHLAEPIIITAENRYCKIMFKRSPNINNIGLACENSVRVDPRAYLGKAKPSRAGVWEDVVFDLYAGGGDLSFEGQEITQLFISQFGTWDGSDTGTCFMDNIILSDNSKPRGANELSAGLMANFEEQGLTDKNFAGFNTQSPDATTSIVDNPNSTASNSSAKCIEYNKPEKTTWWHGLIGEFNGIVPIVYPNSYFHMFMYIPDATSTTLILNTVTGKEAKETFYAGDGWFDCVIDASGLDYLKYFAVRFNPGTEDKDWENPAGKYYIDDIIINNDPEPRSKILGVNENFVNNRLKIYSTNGVAHIVAPTLESVEIYSANGQLVKKESSQEGNISFELENGVYVVKVLFKSGQIETQKLVVL